MTNRIDLSKYDGITQGEWERDYESVICKGLMVADVWCGDDNSTANADLVADSPKLVEELRRAYAEIDELEKSWKTVLESVKNSDGLIYKRIEDDA